MPKANRPTMWGDGRFVEFYDASCDESCRNPAQAALSRMRHRVSKDGIQGVIPLICSCEAS
ncbi:MAG: hypothetical protein UX15_C0040G0010 [Parcubacteria group bacterium GW2011_GWA1_45_7]|nr:MAG: hypothetical protein UX15_C0040G0010 [Parcubacteria group bacterium GW2011_GWA1_45_7]